jgi:hypothetical protein
MPQKSKPITILMADDDPDDQSDDQTDDQTDDVSSDDD